MGAAIGGNLRDQLWGKLQVGDLTELGRPSRILTAANHAMQAGQIKTRADFDAFLQNFYTNYKPPSAPGAPPAPGAGAPPASAAPPSGSPSGQAAAGAAGGGTATATAAPMPEAPPAPPMPPMPRPIATIQQEEGVGAATATATRRAEEEAWDHWHNTYVPGMPQVFAVPPAGMPTPDAQSKQAAQDAAVNSPMTPEEILAGGNYPQAKELVDEVQGICRRASRSSTSQGWAGGSTRTARWCLEPEKSHRRATTSGKWTPTRIRYSRRHQRHPRRRATARAATRSM